MAALEPTDLTTRQALFDLALRAKNGAAMKECVADIRDIEGPDGALWRFGEAARLIAQARACDRSVPAEALTRTRLLAEARTLIKAAAKRRGWSRLTLLQAELEELEGGEEAALGSYLQAIEQGERQPTVIRRIVRLLYERERYAEAYRVLGRLAEQEETTISGELRRLAAELALRTQDYKRALKLAQKAVGSGHEDYRDQIWLGQILWAVGRKKDAQAAFEQAVAEFSQEPAAWVALIQFLHQSGQLTEARDAIERAAKKLPADKGALALAQCHEVVGNAPEAARLYLQALNAGPDSVPVLRQVADYLLRTGGPRVATPLLRQLLALRTKAAKTEHPWARRNLAIALATSGTERDFAEALDLVNENLRTGGVEDQRAKAAVLATRPAHRREAIRLLEEASRKRRGSPAQEFLLAQLYESTGRKADAEALLRQSIEQKETPAKLLALAELLARGKKVGPALDLCKRAARAGALGAAAITSAAVVRTGRGQEADCRRAERLLKEALTKERSPVLLQALAELEDHRGRYDEAQALYREVLKQGQSSPVVLNNLAWLLALSSGRAEQALGLIEQALKTAGPVGGLLDTRAVIYLTLGRTKDAVQDLQKAVAETPTPARYFHLALAQKKAGDRDAAVRAWQEAGRLGLSPEALHPLEKGAYQLLLAELGRG
jgi:tetratricopeptide (TPR) repeat protein